MKRNHELRFKCSKVEKEKIKQKAEKLGMTIASFLRYLALNSKIKVETNN